MESKNPPQKESGIVDKSMLKIQQKNALCSPVVTHVSVSYKELNLTSNIVAQAPPFVHAAIERILRAAFFAFLMIIYIFIS